MVSNRGRSAVLRTYLLLMRYRSVEGNTFSSRTFYGKSCNSAFLLMVKRFFLQPENAALHIFQVFQCTDTSSLPSLPPIPPAFPSLPPIPPAFPSIPPIPLAFPSLPPIPPAFPPHPRRPPGWLHERSLRNYLNNYPMRIFSLRFL